MSMLSRIHEALWDSFIDSSHDILKQVEVLAISKMKDKLQQPSYELSHRSGNLARAVQNAPISTEFASGSLASATAKVDAPNAHLLVEGKYPVTQRQKAFFRYLSIMARGGQGTGSYGQVTPLSELYANMGNPKTQATIYGRPYLNRAMEEVKWFDVVKKNIQTRVKNEVTRIQIG